MRNIICITQSFPPLPGARSIQGHRALADLHKYGFWPVIYCERPAGSMHRLDHSITGKMPANYEVHHVGSLWRFRIFRWVIRAFPAMSMDMFAPGPSSFASWNLPLRFGLMFLDRRRFDLIFSISAPVADHMTGLFLKKRLNLPWVAFFSDPWVSNPYIDRSSCRNLKMHEELEKKVMDTADILVFPTDYMRDIVLSGYPAEHKGKSCVIPHSFYPHFNSIRPKPRTTGPDKILFRYVGSFYGKRTPESIMAAIAIAKDREKGIESRLQFESVGMSHLDMKPFREKYRIGPEFAEVPCVGYLESLEYMKGADVLVSLDIAAKVNPFLSVKLVEYIGARKPILGITPEEGASADLIRRAKGFLAAPERPGEIADRIIEIVKKAQSGELVYNEPDEDLVKRHRQESVASEYAKVFERALGKK